MSSHDEPTVLGDAWFQVFGLLALVSGVFTAHYFLVRNPLRLPAPSAPAMVQIQPQEPAAKAPGQTPAPARLPSRPAASSGPHARLPGHWLVDAQDGPEADCSTLTAALSGAHDGDTITVKPGIYRESLMISKAVTIEGSGDAPDQVEVSYSGPQTVALSGGRATLRNLSLTNTGEHNYWVVNSANARLTLDRVKMRSAGEGIRVLDSDLTVRDSELDARHTLYVEGKSRVSLTKSTLTGQDSALMATGGGASVEIEGGKVVDSRGTGIEAERFARVKLNGVTLTGNVSAAVFARSGAEVRIARTTISDNRDCAVRMDGGLVTFDRVRVERDRCGVGFVGPATLESRDSEFSDLVLGALAIKPGLEDSIVVRGSGNTGLKIPAQRKAGGQ